MLSYYYLLPSHLTLSLLISPHSAFNFAAVFIPTANCRQQNKPTEFGESNQAFMLCMYWYGIFHSRECRAWEPFLRNSKALIWICDSLKWEDSIDIILIIALKSRTCTLDIVGLREWIREMHFAQTREKRMRGVAVPTGSTGPHLTESPSPRRFQLHEVGSSILTH